MTNDNGKFRVYDNTSTPTESINRTWTGRNSAAIIGALFDGTQFITLENGNFMTKYEDATTHHWTVSDNGIWWGSYSWIDTNTGLETKIGPRQKFYMASRARLRITSGPVPTPLTEPMPIRTPLNSIYTEVHPTM